MPNGTRSASMSNGYADRLADLHLAAERHGPDKHYNNVVVPSYSLSHSFLGLFSFCTQIPTFLFLGGAPECPSGQATIKDELRLEKFSENIDSSKLAGNH